MSLLAQQFKQSGYVVVKNLLSPEEVTDYKTQLQQVSGLTDKDCDRSWQCPDGVAKNPQFWSLIWHPILLEKIREILGNSARFTQHSDLHVHRKGAGWHRDSAHRTYGVGSDWDESHEQYRVARVAIYLQSYAESGSSLIFIPGSHRYEVPLSPIERKLWRGFFKLKKLGSKNGSSPYDFQVQFRTTPSQTFIQPPTQPVSISTEPGDCFIFDPRIIHTGSPIHGQKYAIFLSYGVENSHSRNHRRYYLQEREDLDYQEFQPDLKEKLKSKNLLIEV